MLRFVERADVWDLFSIPKIDDQIHRQMDQDVSLAACLCMRKCTFCCISEPSPSFSKLDLRERSSMTQKSFNSCRLN